VDVPAFYLRGIADVPRGSRLVRVEVDGTITPAPYETTGRHPEALRRTRRRVDDVGSGPNEGGKL